MKILKRAVAVFSAVATLTALGSIPASAYDDCDVNHDGVVDISDAVEEAKYLAGKQYGGYYNCYDTNKSLTVDAADSDKIMANIMGLTYQAKYWSKTYASTVNFPTVSGFTPEPDATSTTSRQYIKYNYSSGQTSTYWLTPPSEISNLNGGDDLTDQIIGIDDREPSYGSENSGIVDINSSSDYILNGSVFHEYGTGFIVGKHVIATSASKCYGLGSTNSTKHFYQNLTVTMYNANGTLSNIHLTPLEVHVPVDFTTNLQYGGKYDYALIVVSENLSGYTHFRLGTTYNLSASNYTNVPVYIVGPNEPHSYSSTPELSYGEGNILDAIVSPNPARILCDTDSIGYDRGAPIYTITRVIYGNDISYIYTAIAIFNMEGHQNNIPYNSGTRITKYQLQFYDEHTNTNISY